MAVALPLLPPPTLPKLPIPNPTPMGPPPPPRGAPYSMVWASSRPAETVAPGGYTAGW